MVPPERNSLVSSERTPDMPFREDIRAGRKNRAGMRLVKRFEATRDIGVLEEALSVLGEAVSLATSASTGMLAGVLINFCNACSDGFEATGDSRWQDRAIAMLSETPLPGPSDVVGQEDEERGQWSQVHHCLAHFLHQRGQGLADAEAALTAAFTAVLFAIVSSNSIRFSESLRLWTTVLQRLSNESADVTDLINAEDDLSGIVQRISDRVEACELWAALGIIQRTIYGIMSSQEALNRAVGSYQHAFRLTSPEDPPKKRLDLAINLVIALRYRYEAAGDDTDYQMALAVLEKARAAANATFDLAELSKVHHHASRLLEVAAGRTDSSTVRAELRRSAADHAREAVAAVSSLAPTVDPQQRFELETQCLWAGLAAGDGANGRLLDSVARSLTGARATAILDRLMSATGYMSSDSTEVFDGALAIMENAISLATTGSVDHADFLHAQAVLSIRAGSTLTQDTRNRRAEKMFAAALESPAARTTTRVAGGLLLGWLRSSREEWAGAANALEVAIKALASVDTLSLSLEQQVRRVIAASGFARLGGVGLVGLAAVCAVRAGDTTRALMLVEQGMTILTGTRGDLPDVRVLAERGPIVVVFSSAFGDHAIIITSNTVEAIDLFAENETQAQVAALDQRDSVKENYDDRINEVLEWLWRVVARPVFDHLAERGFTPERIWWLPIGPYAFLPLHAAGYHRQRAGDTVMDRCVSSYLTNLATLRDHRASPADRPDLRTALPVAFAGPDPDVENYYLAAAHDEVKGVTGILMSGIPLTGSNATIANVLARSHEAGLVHFACHGYANLSRPSDSHLVLSDGNLTVARLAEAHSDSTWLAYLSACHSATPSILLDEQPVHIASAFQQAGYRHVIGTLWPIWDDPEPAYRFYTHLLVTDPADALHRTVQSFRNDAPEKPSCWAALVHLGSEA